MSFQLRQAQKSKSKMRLGLSGPSGSGKTYSALLLASGIAAWDKICLIDTENGSGELYSNLGKYNVIVIDPPYSPERYIEAINAAEEAGMEVIIVDSASHEWDGAGGCLQINEQLANTKFKGNTWAAWSQTTPRHQKFIYSITGCKAHIITTARSKTDTIQTEDKKIKKVGLKEIQREGYEYELTVNFNLDRDGNFAIASKDRTGMFIDVDPFKITKKTGQAIKKWADDGVDTEKLAAEIEAMLTAKNRSVQPALDAYKVGALSELSFSSLTDLKQKVEKLEVKKDEPKEPEKPKTPPAQPADPKPQADPAKTPETSKDDFEAEMDRENSQEVNVDDIPDDLGEKKASIGEIALLKSVVKRRATQNGKKQEEMLATLLKSLKKESWEDVASVKIQAIINKATEMVEKGEEDYEQVAKDALGA